MKLDIVTDGKVAMVHVGELDDEVYGRELMNAITGFIDVTEDRLSINLELSKEELDWLKAAVESKLLGLSPNH